ncbi:serine/threonine-protein phosphatase 7 long form homolog [Coffea arabica]|uniref:Serine/threonine-protein phosphatase 7 long form homolog n=1 Tax=Coffea arabica TaxID=13443 RepID=A0ABM4W269_COFAR|nr:uncharacterized protein LOC113706693 [Coffea arabica]
MDRPQQISQLLTVPMEVRRWPGLLSFSEINQVASYLGPIGDFKDIESDGYLVEALIQLWDPDGSTFRIGSKELTPTIEEVAGLLNLSVKGTAVIFPIASGKVEFCHFTGLKESVVRGSDQSIDVKFLFDRFAMKDGFDKYSKDFSFTSKVTWECKRPLVYGLVMAGIYLFPRKDKKIGFKITKLLSDLFFGIKDRQASIVPIVLADIFVACTNCQRGSKFFYGSNRILHIWAMEHFRRQLPALDGLPLIGYNWISTHHKRVDQSNLPRSASEWLDFLRVLSDQKIRWVLDWTDCFNPVLRAKSSDLIPLLGTQGIMAYTPKRFLRQLGRIQGVPLTPDLTDFTISFGKGICPDKIPMKVSIVEAWETLSDDEDIAYVPQLKQMALVTPQYEEWLRESGAGRPLMEQSEEVKKLMAIIEAKDTENAQLRQSVKVNKGLAEKNKRLCEEMQERHQELKRKCGRLYDQTERMQNPYSREPKDAVIDRLKKFNDLVRNQLREMM